MKKRNMYKELKKITYYYYYFFFALRENEDKYVEK